MNNGEACVAASLVYIFAGSRAAVGSSGGVEFGAGGADGDKARQEEEEAGRSGELESLRIATVKVRRWLHWKLQPASASSGKNGKKVKQPGSELQGCNGVTKITGSWQKGGRMEHWWVIMHVRYTQEFLNGSICVPFYQKCCSTHSVPLQVSTIIVFFIFLKICSSTSESHFNVKLCLQEQDILCTLHT